MSNNFFQRLRDRLFVFPWERFLYPLGALAIGALLLVSFIATKRYFTLTIRRVTTVPVARANATDTFHLALYRTIAPAFALLPKSLPKLPSVDRGGVTIGLRNAQERNDRVALLTTLLKDDGWKISVLPDTEGEQIPFAVATTIATKKAYADAAALLATLLTRKGFVVRVSVLPDTDAQQIVLTIGAY